LRNASVEVLAEKREQGAQECRLRLDSAELVIFGLEREVLDPTVEPV
jgi:hypothetical protein